MDITKNAADTLGISADQAEHAYWQFDARRKGYAEWKGAPQSERDAFKAEYRSAIAMCTHLAVQSQAAPVAEAVPEGWLAYIDPECKEAQENRLSTVSGFVAGKAFNEICHLIGGRWPDAKMQEEAPNAYRFFMELFGTDPTAQEVTQQAAPDDLTTVDCIECGGSGEMFGGFGCDECDGQGKLIMSLKDMADLAPTTSTVSAPTDSKLMNFLDQWVKDNEARGFKWFTFAFDTNKSAREQVEVEMVKSSTAAQAATDKD